MVLSLLNIFQPKAKKSAASYSVHALESENGASISEVAIKVKVCNLQKQKK